MAMEFHQREFGAGRLDLFAAQTIDPSNWRRLGARPPYWVFIRSPASAEEEAGAAATLLFEGQTPHQLLFLYQPLARYWAEVERRALSSEALALTYRRRQPPRTRN